MKKAKTTLPHPANSAHQLSAQQVANLKSQIVTSNAGTPPATPLPADWRMGVLSELCTLVRDQCDPTKTDRDTYVGLEHIDSGAFTLSRSGHPREVVSAKTCFRKGDILYGKLRPYLDKAAIADKDGICSTDILVFRPTKTTCAQYLLALLHTPGFVDYAVQTTHGVNHPRTSWSSLSNFRHPLPPLAEQERIAAILWKIQEAIETEAAIIRNARDLKKSLLRHLFTHGLRNEPLKETEIGKIPESWTQSTLGRVCSSDGGRIQTGPFGSQLHASDYRTAGIPVVNPTHLADNRVNHENIPKIDHDAAMKLKRHVLEAGDILFARRGEIGRHGMIGKAETGWLCGTGCFLVRINSPTVCNEFISHWLSTQPLLEWLDAHAAGAIMPNLNSVVLGRIPLFMPEIDEQRDIASILATADAKIGAHEAKQHSLTDLFKTMLHRLLNGTFRTDTVMSETPSKECL